MYQCLQQHYKMVSIQQNRTEEERLLLILRKPKPPQLLPDPSLARTLALDSHICISGICIRLEEVQHCNGVLIVQICLALLEAIHCLALALWRGIGTVTGNSRWWPQPVTECAGESVKGLLESVEGGRTGLTDPLLGGGC
jgi:hypothetical protein